VTWGAEREPGAGHAGPGTLIRTIATTVQSDDTRRRFWAETTDHPSIIDTFDQAGTRVTRVVSDYRSSIRRDARKWAAFYPAGRCG